MKDDVLQAPLDDKKLADEIRNMAATQIKWLLKQHDQMLLPEEKKLKYDILKAMAPNLFPRAKQDETIPEEVLDLTVEEQDHLNKILNG